MVCILSMIRQSTLKIFTLGKTLFPLKNIAKYKSKTGKHQTSELIVYYPFVYSNTPLNAARSLLIVLMGVARLYQERRYV